MCLASLFRHRMDDHQLGARSPVAVTPHLVGRASLFCQGMSPTSDFLMIISQTATTFRGFGNVHQVSVASFRLTTYFPSSAFGSSWLTSLSLFFMKTVQPKLDNLLNESLVFILRISSAGPFSSFCFTTKFLIFVA